MTLKEKNKKKKQPQLNDFRFHFAGTRAHARTLTHRKLKKTVFACNWVWKLLKPKTTTIKTFLFLNNEAYLGNNL